MRIKYTDLLAENHCETADILQAANTVGIQPNMNLSAKKSKVLMGQRVDGTNIEHIKKFSTCVRLRKAVVTALIIFV